MSAKIFTLSKSANKQIVKLPLSIQNKINQAFITIKNNPLAGAKLNGVLAGQYKFRIGDYRIVYTFNSKENKVCVVKIEHRQGVYK